jgi:sortase A
MPQHRNGRSGSPGAAALRWAERLLVIAGTALLAWCALIVADARLAQRAARGSLEIASQPDPSFSAPQTQTTGAVPVPAAAIRMGSAVAELSIPRVHLSAVVLHGSDDRVLRRGPGHLENSALPGESGNMVIAGHRDTFFRPLRNVRAGDDIFVDMAHGRFHYRVASLRVVEPHDLSVLDQTAEAVLTLITCYPFWALGPAPDRFVVRARRVVEEVAPFAMAPSPESIRAPLLRALPADDPVVSTSSRAFPDDEGLVRQAIERFRLTYNARLISHSDVRREGPLKFQTCEIAIDNLQATATCTASSQSSAGPEAQVWILTLVHAGDRWAIQSVARS